MTGAPRIGEAMPPERRRDDRTVRARHARPRLHDTVTAPALDSRFDDPHRPYRPHHLRCHAVAPSPASHATESIHPRGPMRITARRDSVLTPCGARRTGPVRTAVMRPSSSDPGRAGVGSGSRPSGSDAGDGPSGVVCAPATHASQAASARVSSTAGTGSAGLMTEPPARSRRGIVREPPSVPSARAGRSGRPCLPRPWGTRTFERRAVSSRPA